MLLAFPLNKNCVYKLSSWNQTPMSTKERLCEKYKSHFCCRVLLCVSAPLYEHTGRTALLFAIFSYYVRSNEKWQCNYELYGPVTLLKKKAN